MCRSTLDLRQSRSGSVFAAVGREFRFQPSRTCPNRSFDSNNVPWRLFYCVFYFAVAVSSFLIRAMQIGIFPLFNVAVETLATTKQLDDLGTLSSHEMHESSRIGERNSCRFVRFIVSCKTAIDHSRCFAYPTCGVNSSYFLTPPTQTVRTRPCNSLPSQGVLRLCECS